MGAVTAIIGGVFGAGGVWVRLRLRLLQLEKEVASHSAQFDKVAVEFKEVKVDQESKFNVIKEMMMAHETELKELGEGKVKAETTLEFIKNAVERITDKLDSLGDK